MELKATKLDYFDDMFKLRSKAKILSFSKSEDGRDTIVLESTIFHSQGGGQPADTGFITAEDSTFKFIVQDVRSKCQIVYHYGVVEGCGSGLELETREGREVLLHVDEGRRKLNSRLHSAGHLLDACLPKAGLGHLEPGKAYHFPDGPYVEYKGVISQSEWETKRKLLEEEANALISKGCRVFAHVLPYEEASEMCGGTLPEYIPKGSSPRIVKLGNYPGCPCGGTHVFNISEIVNLKVSQIRSKKGMTKVFYNVP